MKILFCIFIQLVGLWLDVFFSNNGYNTSFCLVSFTYMIINYNWFWALPFSLISFIIYETLTGLPLTNFLLIVFIVSLVWERKIDCSRLNLLASFYVSLIILQYIYYSFILSVSFILIIKTAIMAIFITVPLGIGLTKLFNKISFCYDFPPFAENYGSKIDE